MIIQIPQNLNKYNKMGNLENKAKKITSDILSAVGKKDDPIGELLEVYVLKQLKETYEDGIKHGMNQIPY